MIKVFLSSTEMARAQAIGLRRLKEAKGQPRWAYEGRSGKETHTIGAQAELAFARSIDVPWPARVNVGHREPDVDPFWEVRWSQLPTLKVATNDPPERAVVKVSGKPPHFEIVGYILAGGVKDHYSLQDPGSRGRPAYFVPDSRLVPIDPGFHDLCHWMKHEGRFMCFMCGAFFEEPATDEYDGAFG